ncbi:MAG: tyrosine-type recombinase/integrase [Candidatus Marinimicrobia bacterium]|nr:tyrosine-type recombinase/integrase [Candidatus Neomarinimicrobiota bacterium]
MTRTPKKVRNPDQKGMRLLKKSYYHRYTHKGKTRPIPLKTGDINLAIERNKEVLKHLPEIKANKPVYLYWLDDLTRMELEATLQVIGKRFIDAKRRDGIRESTITLYERMIRFFIKVNGNIDLNKLTIDHVDNFKDLFIRNGTGSPNTNKNLRHLKAFLRWCKDRKYLTNVPPIKQIRIPISEPKYFSNAEYETIQELLNPFMCRFIHLYRSTGMRLEEGLNGEIKGGYFVISADNYKTNRTHSFPLDDEMKVIIVELQAKKHLGAYYSRDFKKACVNAGILDKHFHHLRNTFALRTYLQTGDLYKVKKLLGHSSITTTEKYADFDWERLSKDFPDLVSNSNEKNKLSQSTQSQALNPYYLTT